MLNAWQVPLQQSEAWKTNDNNKPKGQWRNECKIQNNKSSRTMNLSEISLPKQLTELCIENLPKRNDSQSSSRKNTTKLNDINPDDALRKMLRIESAPTFHDKQEQIFSNTQAKNSHPIDLNELFGKQQPRNALNNTVDVESFPDVSSLPKPPANWHQPAKQGNNKSMGASQLFGPQLLYHQATAPVPPQQQQHSMFMPNHQPQFKHLQPSFHQNFNPPMNLQPNLINSQILQHPRAIKYRMPTTFHPTMYMPPQSNFPFPTLNAPPPFVQGNHFVRVANPTQQNMFYHNPRQQMNTSMANYHDSQALDTEINKNTPYNSAFIPLQAARKITKSKVNGNDAAKFEQKPANELKPIEVFSQRTIESSTKSSESNAHVEVFHCNIEL